MKATINNTQITGFVGQDVGGYRYLFVNGTSSKTRRSSYPVARVVTTDTGYSIISIEDQQALSDYGNEQVARALVG